jgi:hypothetical protein
MEAKMGERVFQLIKEGNLVQGLIALAATGTVIYLAVAQIPESEALLVITGAAVGHFFQMGAARAAERRVLRTLGKE